MRIRVSLSSCTGEASSCVCQAVDRLSAEIERLDDSAPPFSLIDTLQIHLNIAHPCSSEGGGRGRGSFHAATRTFYAGAALTYEPWISSDWATRLSDLGDGMARAVAAIHKTRITEAERTAAADVIKAAITRVASSPPTELLSLKPIYLVYAGDDTRPTISFGSPSLWTDSSYRIVVVPPPDALKYAYLRDDRKAAQPKMFKLYRRLETGLEYWEAWPADGLVVEHRGICGERGTTRELAAADAKVQAKMLMDLNVEAKTAGFKKIPNSRHARLLVETDISGFGGPADLDTRHRLEEFLNELTGWLGLGHCDGGSIGSGTMEAFCLVVDYDIAARAITAALARSEFLGFRVRRAD